MALLIADGKYVWHDGNVKHGMENDCFGYSWNVTEPQKWNPFRNWI